MSIVPSEWHIYVYIYIYIIIIIITTIAIIIIMSIIIIIIIYIDFNDFSSKLDSCVFCSISAGKLSSNRKNYIAWMIATPVVSQEPLEAKE